jgi:hypothetical protein
MPGPQPPTSVAVLSSSTTLTDAEIKTAPTVPVVLVPATETLDYSGLPTVIFLPLAMIISIDATAGAYTNLDSNLRFIIAMGSDWSTDALRTDGNIAHIQDAVASFGAANTFQQTTIGSVIQPLFVNGGALLDNALVFVIGNGEVNLTGGNAANSMKVTVLYTEIHV